MQLFGDGTASAVTSTTTSSGIAAFAIIVSQNWPA
jgi:hypothetical protein